ncbi:MAG: hypothetical protein JNK33_00315 [Candidatus Doudnabacteria bacterium]|nr:hypothetical protein [Candidatus Doudnabacteria bacterium]
MLIIAALVFLSKLVTLQLLLSTASVGVGAKFAFNEFYPVLLMFIFYSLLGGAGISQRNFADFMRLYVYFVVFAGVYNFGMNFDRILSFTSSTGLYTYELQSFFENRNAYGLVLAFGIIATFYLKAAKRLKNCTANIIAAFLSVNIFLTLSRGAIGIILIFAFIYSIQKGFVAFTKFLATMIVLVATLCLVFGTTFLSENLIRAESGTTHRSAIQSYGLNYFYTGNELFGTGEKIRPLLKDEFNVSSVHNSYVDMLVTGGWLMIVLYCLLIAAILHTSVRLPHSYRNEKRFFYALFIAYFLYSLIETAIPFKISPTSAVITIFIYITPLYIRNGATNFAQHPIR